MHLLLLDPISFIIIYSFLSLRLLLVVYKLETKYNKIKIIIKTNAHSLSLFVLSFLWFLSKTIQKLPVCCTQAQQWTPQAKPVSHFFCINLFLVISFDMFYFFILFFFQWLTSMRPYRSSMRPYQCGHIIQTLDSLWPSFQTTLASILLL